MTNLIKIVFTLLYLPALQAQSGKSNPIQQYARYFNTHPNTPCTTGHWVCIGPFDRPPEIKNCRGCSPTHSGTGQMQNIRLSPNYRNDSTLFACSTWGGLWKSTDRGKHWWSLNTDMQLPFTSVADIAIDPTNTAVLYITTGESQRTSGHFSLKQDGSTSAFTPLFTSGVYSSVDGGLHWRNINGKNQALLDYFSNGGVMRKILLHPFNPKKLLFISTEGLFQTEDATLPEPVWSKLTNDIQDEDLNGLAFHPTNPNTIYISGRDIYRSTDGGRTFSAMTGPASGLDLRQLPDSFTVGRINIAVTPANPAKLYAYIVGSSPKCSGGKAFIYVHYEGKWTLQHAFCAGSAFDVVSVARMAVVVSPVDEDEIYFGHTKVQGTKSMQKPASFRAVSPYYSTGQFHADVFSLAIDPDGQWLFATTDGGIHQKDLAASGTDGWTDISNGLAISTPYRFDDTDDHTDRIMMGTQDCGTFIYTHQYGWQNIYGGDGYNGKIDGVTGLAFGHTSGAKGLLIYDFNTNSLEIENHRTTFPIDPQPNQGLSWLRGTYDMINHPVTEKMYFSFTEIYERQKARASSGDRAADLWQIQSDIGKTTPAQWQRQLQTFDMAESNPDYMYVVQNGGVWDNLKAGFSIEPRLFRSTTGGCRGMDGYNNTSCFTDITPNLIRSGISNTYQPVNTAPDISIPVITGVTFHPEKHLVAWITFTGYEPGIKVWQTSDGGDTWQNADPEGSLHNLPVNDIVYQRGSKDRLYIGTDAGIYFKDAGMTTWESYCDFPHVRVVELKINYCMGKIRAATFGRSIWEGDLLPGAGTLGQSELVIQNTPDTAWTFSRGLDRNLRIKSGAVLTIEGPSAATPILISMPRDGRIVVEKGGKLILKNAVLTNNCGEKWLGIEVEGNWWSQLTGRGRGVVEMRGGEVVHVRN